MSDTNPLRSWQVDRTAIRHVGHGLRRPECVLAERDGTLWAADARGGAMRIEPDGNQQLVMPTSLVALASVADFETPYVQSRGSLPNGMAFLPNGDFVIANWGSDSVTMTRDGQVRRLIEPIDGQPLGKANFVLREKPSGRPSSLLGP